MYQVWTKGDEYSGWARKDCPDLKAALAEVLETIRAGKDPLLTVEVKYAVGINVMKEAPVEAKKSEAEPDKDTGGKSHRKVRRGDKAAVEGLDKGSGDSGAGSGAGDKQ